MERWLHLAEASREMCTPFMHFFTPTSSLIYSLCCVTWLNGRMFSQLHNNLIINPLSHSLLFSFLISTYSDMLSMLCPPLVMVILISPCFPSLCCGSKSQVSSSSFLSTMPSGRHMRSVNAVQRVPQPPQKMDFQDECRKNSETFMNMFFSHSNGRPMFCVCFLSSFCSIKSACCSSMLLDNR